MELFLLALLVHLLINLWLIVSAFTRSVLWGILVLLFSPLAAIAYGITNFRDAKLPFLLYLASAVFAIAAFFMITPKEWQVLCERTSLCQPSDLAGFDRQTTQSPVPPQGTTPAPAVVPTPPTGQPAMPANPPGTPPIQVNLPAKDTKSEPPVEPSKATAKRDAVKRDDQENDPMVNFPAKHSLVKEDPLEIKKIPPPKLTETINPARVGKYLNRYLIVTLTNKVERRGLLKKVTKTTLILERKWTEKGSTSYSVDRSRIKKILVLKEIPKEDE